VGGPPCDAELLSAPSSQGGDHLGTGRVRERQAHEPDPRHRP
jgi:hypothetical protein